METRKICNNIQMIKKNIENARKDSFFSGNVEFIAVTKNRSISDIEKVIACGILNLGENRVQELLEKYDYFGDTASWHMIGTLQKNKVKYIIDKVDLIHSLDSIPLAKEIDKQAKNKDTVMNVLIQVNVANESTKHGFKTEMLNDVIEELSLLKNLNVKGLMMIAPNTDDQELLESLFEKTKNIFDKLVKKTKIYDNINLAILSMGMTGDYRVAIKHGSNMVRIGRAVFN